MATYITIVDTEKTGWLNVKTNELYTNGVVVFKELNIEKASINAVNITKDSLGVECLEIHTTNTATPYFISNDCNQSKYYPIESVNGVAPDSLDNLKTKILNLL